ncbi:MAG: PH domain-containing protein [Solirubrobacteraceae bacterium]|nr:PH domain-containing protein [Solirubrobacteraceae bacterium]
MSTRYSRLPRAAGGVAASALTLMALVPVVVAPSPLTFVAVAVLWVPVVWLVYRLVSASVLADDDGVTIRNVAKTRRLAWDEIDTFVYQASGSCFVRLADGEELAIQAFQEQQGRTDVDDTEPWLRDSIAELNARAATATAR